MNGKKIDNVVFQLQEVFVIYNFTKQSHDLANMSSTLPCIINLVNTAFGVTVLAVPYCLHQCGIILGILLLILSSYASKRSCSLLLRSSQISRRRDFESLGFFVDGFLGKCIVEMSLIGYLVGTAIAWFVVIGDVAPAVLSSLLGVEKSWGLRMILIVVIGLAMVLPLSMVKDITSLSSASKVAIAIYSVFVLQLFFSTLPQILSGEWIDTVNFWKPEGILQCLPIFGISFLIQTVLFVIYEALPEPSVIKMENVVGTAMDIVLLLSATVGFCGYVKYSGDGIQGDLLNNYKHDFVSEFIRLGFCVSTILSFPLLVFPCRSSIHSMISNAQMTSVEGSPGGRAFIPHDRFVAITCSLVISTLIFGILFPNVEFVMALVGATMGALLTYVLPSYIFLKVAGEDTSKTEAKILLVVGICLFSLSTFSVLNMSESHREVVPIVQAVHPAVQDAPNLGNINTNISLKSTEELTKVVVKPVVKPVVNESLDDKVQKLEDQKTTKKVKKRDTANTIEDSRKEPVLPQGRVLMSQAEANTINVPPVVNDTVRKDGDKERVVDGKVRLQDGEGRAVDGKVRLQDGEGRAVNGMLRTTEKVLGNLDKNVPVVGRPLKERDENIGNFAVVLRKSNTTNRNVSFEGRLAEGENDKANSVPSDNDKQDGVVDVATGNREDISRKHQNYQDVKSKKLLKGYLTSISKRNKEISNLSSVHREI